MNDKCNLCRYVLMDTHAHDGYEPYRCTNQESPNFGQPTGEGCKEYERFNPRPDMSFKDALETLVMLPHGAYPDYWFKFGKEDEVSRPFYCISFESNNQMNQYQDAMMRCFDELMKMKRAAGDFEEPEQGEGEKE